MRMCVHVCVLQALYTALDQAFTQWHARQALAQQQNGTGEGALPTNGLYGDVRCGR
jgi:hypothetical protein